MSPDTPTIAVMKTYTFEGKQPVFIPQYGQVQPGETVASVEPIHHPEFKEQKEGDAKASKK